MRRILVTGGLGYIGSHTCVSLVEAGYHPVVIDNLRNSQFSVKGAIEEITHKPLEFYQIDAKDFDKIYNSVGRIDGVIHFAALKSVEESFKKPLEYYSENLGTLLNIIKIANAKRCKSLIFSSSATVYGDTREECVTEVTPLGNPLNPYGHTKLLGENILQNTMNSFNAVLLRYFNPIGAHESAMIGELPIGIPNNLVPYITQTAAGKRNQLTVFGQDYNTKDGTCIRDFIHVTDLAEAHVAAINYSRGMSLKSDIFNVGTGKGYTVLELIKTFEQVNNIKLNYCFGQRRKGDIESIYAQASKIKEKLNWQAKKSLAQSLKDSWKWERNSISKTT